MNRCDYCGAFIGKDGCELCDPPPVDDDEADVTPPKPAAQPQADGDPGDGMEPF